MIAPSQLDTSKLVRATCVALTALIGAMLGGCAQFGASTKIDAQLGAAKDGAKPTQTELERATAHWGKEFDKNPKDATAAVNFVKNLKAMGKRKEAFSILQAAVIYNGTDRALASEYGRLAIEFEQIAAAQRMLEVADDPLKPDWRVLSARGTVMAKLARYKDAIPFYEKALALQPNRASILNNLGLAHMALGDAGKGEDYLRRAAAAGGAPKVQQNLALALGVQGKYDEAKAVTATLAANGEASDVDYMRRLVKLPPKAAPVAVTVNASAAGSNWSASIQPAKATVSAPMVPSREVAKPGIVGHVVEAEAAAQAKDAVAASTARGGVFQLKPTQN